MQNKNWEKIRENVCNRLNFEKGMVGYIFISEAIKIALQNQRQEFVDIVEKVNSENAKSGRYFNAGSAIVCEEILKELNK